MGKGEVVFRTEAEAERSRKRPGCGLFKALVGDGGSTMVQLAERSLTGSDNGMAKAGPCQAGPAPVQDPSLC